MTEKIAFGGGCFWCTEAVFQKLKGVTRVTSGYAEETEVIEVEYNPEVIKTDKLIEVFSAIHDPFSRDRQGADVGIKYRSVILFTNDWQRESAEKWKMTDPKIVTEIKPLITFLPAEEYHRDFFNNNQDVPYCSLVIRPKLQKAEKLFKDIMRV